MGKWKHDRDYYQQRAKVLKVWHIAFIICTIISVEILIVKWFEAVYILPVVIYTLLLVITYNLKRKARKNFHRAPSFTVKEDRE